MWIVHFIFDTFIYSCRHSLLECSGHSITQATPQIRERYILNDVCSGTGSHLTERDGFYEPKRNLTFSFDACKRQLSFWFIKIKQMVVKNLKWNRAREAEGRERWSERSILIGSETHVPSNSSLLLASLFYPCDVIVNWTPWAQKCFSKSKYWR